MALGVARLYAGLIDGMIIDSLDAGLGPPIAALGLQVEITDTVMRDNSERQALAETALAFAARLRGVPAR